MTSEPDGEADIWWTHRHTLSCLHLPQGERGSCNGRVVPVRMYVMALNAIGTYLGGAPLPLRAPFEVEKEICVMGFCRKRITLRISARPLSGFSGRQTRCLTGHWFSFFTVSDVRDCVSDGCMVTQEGDRRSAAK